MRIAVTGASGLVGTALREHWASDEITPLVRGYDEPGVRWDPAAGTIDAAGLEGHDAVVHLAGENIASGRWTKRKKACILESRVKGTALLAEALAGLEKKPAVLVSSSAVVALSSSPKAGAARSRTTRETSRIMLRIIWIRGDTN